MKKILALVLLLALAISMTACAPAATTAAPAETTAAPAETTAAVADEPVTIIVTNGKGEIAAQFDQAAKDFMALNPNITVEMYSVTVGDTVSIYDKLTSSGKIVTLAMVEPYAVNDKFVDTVASMDGAPWIAETTSAFKNVAGQVVGFPFAIEGFGLVYNKAVVEKAVPGFDPLSIKTRDQFVELLDKIIASGVKKPIAYQTEAWSVSNHYSAQFINQATDKNAFAADLKAGNFDYINNAVWNGYYDTMDVLADAKYNVYGERPLGSYYDEAHVKVGNGEAAMLFNGNWAFDSLKAAPESSFGFIPVPFTNDAADVNAGKLSVGPTQVFIIDKNATPAEQAAAEKFLEWMVFDEKGMDFVVNQSQIISAFKNNPNKVTNPLGAAIADAIGKGATLDFPTNYVSAGDYYNILGPSVQAYINKDSTREELATAFTDYYATLE
ncbi:MAG: ABC transporter substrate-binding protein [Eubacteriales bacterium]|nr:ABC transporter substrate-binding protein [Eubacteriales bacterium]